MLPTATPSSCAIRRKGGPGSRNGTAPTSSPSPSGGGGEARKRLLDQPRARITAGAGEDPARDRGFEYDAERAARLRGRRAALDPGAGDLAPATEAGRERAPGFVRGGAGHSPGEQGSPPRARCAGLAQRRGTAHHRAPDLPRRLTPPVSTSTHSRRSTDGARKAWLGDPYMVVVVVAVVVVVVVGAPVVVVVLGVVVVLVVATVVVVVVGAGQ